MCDCDEWSCLSKLLKINIKLDILRLINLSQVKLNQFKSSWIKLSYASLKFKYIRIGP